MELVGFRAAAMLFLISYKENSSTCFFNIYYHTKLQHSRLSDTNVILILTVMLVVLVAGN
jgi:hypothetical protein